MLIRKMLRDVWKNKVPFVAIFLMMFAGNFIFSGITSEYNGMNKSFHSFIEETNLADVWVGFNNKRIRKLMIQQNIWLTIVGIIIGLPIGYGLLGIMVSTVQTSIDMETYAPVYVYGVSILGTFILSWIINKVLSLKVKSIDMVSALKINE